VVVVVPMAAKARSLHNDTATRRTYPQSTDIRDNYSPGPIPCRNQPHPVEQRRAFG
jgi:hypothetical protein